MITYTISIPVSAERLLKLYATVSGRSRPAALTELLVGALEQAVSPDNLLALIDPGPRRVVTPPAPPNRRRRAQRKRCPDCGGLFYAQGYFGHRRACSKLVGPSGGGKLSEGGGAR